MSSITTPGSLDSPGHNFIDIAGISEQLDALLQVSLWFLGSESMAEDAHFFDIDMIIGVIVLHYFQSAQLFFVVELRSGNKRDLGIFLIAEVVSFFEFLESFGEFGG